MFAHPFAARPTGIRRNAFFTPLLATWLALFCLAPPGAHAAMVRADFRLVGSHFHTGLGQDANLRLDIRADDISIAAGRLRYNVGWDAPTGIFAGDSMPGQDAWAMIDKTFSAVFDMQPDDPLKLGIDLHAGGSRAVWGFSTHTFMPGDPGTLADLRGLRMTGIALADGRPLAAEGLMFELLPSATELVTGFTIEAAGTSADALLENESTVVIQDGYVSAAVSVVDGLPWLQVNPDPNPFVIDGATARLGPAGVAGNAQVVQAGVPVSLPATALLMLAGAGSLRLAVRLAARQRSTTD
jgi:hypothetical protein